MSPRYAALVIGDYPGNEKGQARLYDQINADGSSYLYGAVGDGKTVIGAKIPGGAEKELISKQVGGQQVGAAWHLEFRLNHSSGPAWELRCHRKVVLTYILKPGEVVGGVYCGFGAAATSPSDMPPRIACAIIGKPA